MHTPVHAAARATRNALAERLRRRRFNRGAIRLRRYVHVKGDLTVSGPNVTMITAVLCNRAQACPPQRQRESVWKKKMMATMMKTMVTTIVTLMMVWIIKSRIMMLIGSVLKETLTPSGRPHSIQNNCVLFLSPKIVLICSKNKLT